MKAFLYVFDVIFLGFAGPRNFLYCSLSATTVTKKARKGHGQCCDDLISIMADF